MANLFCFLSLVILYTICVCDEEIPSKCYSMYGIESEGCQMCENSMKKICRNGEWTFHECNEGTVCYDVIYNNGHCIVYCGKSNEIKMKTAT